MEQDFYIDRRWLASYFEKDWMDFVQAQGGEVPFEFAPFPAGLLYSGYHEDFAAFLRQAVSGFQPANLLEVGSSLGRTFYEVCRRFPELRAATLVEPSQNLARAFQQIFAGDQAGRYPVLLGNRELREVSLDPRDVRSACAKVEWELINRPWAEVADAEYDLVICSNVIDQCEKPLLLAEFLKRQVASGGVLALSCTYQWNDKYVAASETPTRNIGELFTGEWQLLGETNLEFRCRRSERHWLSFLSHVCVFQRRQQLKS